MKIPSLSLILLLVVCAVYSQTKLTGKILARAELKKKLGCIDRKGHEVVPIQYDDIGFWSDGLIAVNKGAKEVDYIMKGGKWGYCDENGKLVIPLQYEEAMTFQEGLAAVRMAGKWGFIDEKGRMVIQPRYKEARIFSEGFCAVRVGEKWGYIDKLGKMVIQPEYAEAFEFGKGLAFAWVGAMANDETGQQAMGGYCLIDKGGHRLTQPIFFSAGRWHEGFVKVKDSLGKVGFINRQGRLVVPLEYDEAEDFSEGLAAAGRRIPSSEPEPQYEYGYIDTTGQLIIKGPFNHAEPFYKGMAIVMQGVQRNSVVFSYSVASRSIADSASLPKFALIDRAGAYVLSFQWGGLHFIDSNRLIASRTGYFGSGVIDIKGKEIVPFSYMMLNYAGNGLLVGWNGEGRDERETSLIDTRGQLLYKTTSFEVPDVNYDHGLLPVRTGKPSRSGCVDAHGRWVIPDKYDMIWDFERTR